MQQQQPQQSNPQGSNRLFTELIKGLIRSICLTIEVFCRWDFGTGYVGCGFMGVVVIWLFSMFFAPMNIAPLIDFSLVYCAVWLVAVVCALIRYWRGGNRLHSKYTGRPFLWRLLSGWKEENVKHLDGAVALLVGFGVHHLNVPLGDYLMAAASVLLLRDYGIVSEQRHRAIEMNDKVIEEKLVAERFRALQDQ